LFLTFKNVFFPCVLLDYAIKIVATSTSRYFTKDKKVIKNRLDTFVLEMLKTTN